MNALGKQVCVEFYDCENEIINCEKKIEELMNEAAKRANATIVKSTFHSFSPQGISGVVVIAESHLAIHTWPEYNFASVDFFTCGTSIDEKKAIEFLKEQFSSSSIELKELKRGEIAKINSENR